MGVTNREVEGRGGGGGCRGVTVNSFKTGIFIISRQRTVSCFPSLLNAGREKRARVGNGRFFFRFTLEGITKLLVKEGPLEVYD